MQKLKYFILKVGLGRSAFTLVELIVVITILAILGIIAFISLTGYSSQARDSTRITDLSSIKASLELFELDAGKYPIPTNGVDIIYSGSVVWNQGTFGKSVYTNVSKLDKIPVDPVTDKEYTYSVISTKNEYELGGIVEGDVIGLNNIILETNAGETVANAYTIGNFNGQMIKSLSGTTCNILSIPSIMTNDTSITDLQQTVTEKRLVYKGYKNLPSSFKTSKFKNDGGFDFIPNKLVVYTDTGSCEPLTSKASYVARVTLLEWLQYAYSGTILQNEGEIKNILDLVIDINNPSREVLTYAGSMVNNLFGGNVSLDNSSFCTGLIGSANPNQWGQYKNFPDFDLCSNTLIFNTLNNFTTSNKLISNIGAREVYAFVLEKGITYTIETLGNDSSADTAIFLYNNLGAKLTMNDDIDLNIARSKILYTPTYTGYYFLGVMGFDDLGTTGDYTLNISY